MNYESTPPMQIAQQVKLFLVAAALCALGASFQGCAASGRGARPGGGAATAVRDPYARQVTLFDAERLLLTSDYSSRHYGRPGSGLTDPQLIVVHSTATATLQETLRSFRSARLDRLGRQEIASGGDVNVSAHYLIDSDGDLYQLAAEDIICRHAIGYNYTAIAIENVAADADRLTEQQARATAALVCRIAGRHPTIRYLIGHHEYRDSTLPHHRLLVERDASYRFTGKSDPGPRFMAQVRQLVHEDCDLTLAN